MHAYILNVFVFLLGVCAVQFFSELQSINIIMGGGFFAFLWIVVCQKIVLWGYFHLGRHGDRPLQLGRHRYWPFQIFKYLLIFFVLGFLWMWIHVKNHLNKALPESIEGNPITVVGTVVSLPERLGAVSNDSLRNTVPITNKIDNQNQTLRFEFNIKNTIPSNDWPNPGCVRLYFHSNKEKIPLIQVGDQWQFRVKLKRPFGYANPGSFDKEKYFFQNRWQAEGSVLEEENTNELNNPEANKKNSNKKISSNLFSKPIDRVRYYLLQKMRNHLNGLPFGELIIALVVGIREGITQTQWQVFRDTGTAHLMAISGLHVGLMAGFAYFIIHFIWRRLRRLFRPSLQLQKLPASWVAAWGGMFAALGYSLLAGFSVPTQRALVMVILFMLNIVFRHRGEGWQNYGIALCIVLLIDPFATLSPGFWLSFGAVGVILYGMQNRLQPTGAWWKWGRTQWVIFLGLSPFTLAFFQQLSLVSPLVNSFAIPWVSFAVVPWALIGTLCLPISETLGRWFLIISEKMFSLLWPLLEFSSKLPKASWLSADFSTSALVLAIIGVSVLLAPRGFPGRWMGLIWLLPILLNKPTSIESGAVRFSVLDVGQGLASVVETANHVLVFDTGPNLSARGMGVDTGERVVLPFLTGKGIKTIDTVVISHGDNDHIGGLLALLKKMQVNSIITSEVDLVRALVSSIHNSVNTKIDKVNLCYVGQRWNWDGVEFEMLHPETIETRKRNDHSCVLRIKAGNKSVLLTGDIETKSENKILEWAKTSLGSAASNYSSSLNNLASDILIVPHHGSRTSSSQEFIQAVNPQYAIIPVGYRNAYGHPKAEIVARYQSLGIKLLDTVHEGSITFILNENGDPLKVLEPDCYRRKNKRFWHAL